MFVVKSNDVFVKSRNAKFKCAPFHDISIDSSDKVIKKPKEKKTKKYKTCIDHYSLNGYDDRFGFNYNHLKFSSPRSVDTSPSGTIETAFSLLRFQTHEILTIPFWFKFDWFPFYRCCSCSKCFQEERKTTTIRNRLKCSVFHHSQPISRNGIKV